MGTTGNRSIYVCDVNIEIKCFKTSPGLLGAFSRMSNGFAGNHESFLPHLNYLITQGITPQVHRAVHSKLLKQGEVNCSRGELMLQTRLHQHEVLTIRPITLSFLEELRYILQHTFFHCKCYVTLIALNKVWISKKKQNKT